MIEVQKEIKQCDILIVGGGIAGLMAAIAAADKGAKVIVAEKADSRRSGSAATGNDHFLCYIPEVHGENIEAYVDELAISLVGDRCDRTLQRQLAERSLGKMGHRDASARRLGIQRSCNARTHAHLAQIQRYPAETNSHQGSQKARRGDRQPFADQ